MSWSRVTVATLLVASVVGCVEQEPYRPTDEDKRIIKQNILSKAPEKLKFKVNADLEGNVTYLGLDVDREVIKPGEQFKLIHYWQVHKALEGWKMFVHLNAPDKKGFINADHLPIGGRYPVSRWKAKEIIRDEHTVTLPANWKESSVIVFTGLWKGPLRMKIKGPQDDEGRIQAATLPVAVAEGPKEPAPRLGRLVALRTAKPVKVDGKLDDEAWSKAAGSGPFVGTMKGEAAPVKTEAKVAYDDKFLYIALAAEDEDIWSELRKRDDKLWTQEALEVFLDANADGKDYIELQVNPHGTIFDSYLPEYRKNQNDWNSKLQVAVSVDGTVDKRGDKDKGWIAEMAIPWEDTRGRGTYKMTFPPKVGDVWRVNFFRMDLPKDKAQLAWGWSPPLVGDFHKLDRFGELVFGDEEGKAPGPAPSAAPEPKAATAPVPAPVRPPPPVVMPPERRGATRAMIDQEALRTMEHRGIRPIPVQRLQLKAAKEAK